MNLPFSLSKDKAKEVMHRLRSHRYYRTAGFPRSTRAKTPEDQNSDSGPDVFCVSKTQITPDYVFQLVLNYSNSNDDFCFHDLAYHLAAVLRLTSN